MNAYRLAFARRVVFIAIVAVVPSGLAASTADVAPDASLDHLVQQLGADKPEDRDVAQKQLQNLGESARPVVQKAATQSSDPEIRSRAGAILADFEDRAWFQASAVTLHVKDQPIAAVLAELSAQSHSQLLMNDDFVIRNQQVNTVNLDCEKLPLWQALEEVAHQSELCPTLDSPRNSNNRSQRFRTGPQNWFTDVPHQIVGAFWVGVTGESREQSLNMQGSATVWDQFYLKLTILPEPKLLTQLAGFTVLEAVDDQGQSLMPLPGAARLRLDQQLDSYSVEVPLSHPVHAGKTIRSLRGEVKVLVGERFREFRVNDVLGVAKVSNELDDATVKFTLKDLGHNYYSVSLAGHGLTGQGWSLSNQELQDEKGNALTTYRGPHGRIGSRQYSPSGDFSSSTMYAPTGHATADVAKTFILQVPAAVRVVTLPVVFHDLPLIGG